MLQAAKLWIGGGQFVTTRVTGPYGPLILAPAGSYWVSPNLIILFGIKVFPSVPKIFLLVTKIFPLVTKVFPSVTKVFLLVTKVSPLVTKVLSSVT